MKLIICFSAPAVMDSMATTAPTPKIMPSMVRRLRSLCASRLARPIVSSGRYPESGFTLLASLGAAIAARRHARHTGASLLLAFLIARLGGRVGERDHFPGFDAFGDHHSRFAAPRQFHDALLETMPALYPHHRFAVFFKDGLGRNVNRVRNPFDRNFHIGKQAGAQQDLQLRILFGWRWQLSALALLLGAHSGRGSRRSNFHEGRSGHSAGPG